MRRYAGKGTVIQHLGWLLRYAAIKRKGMITLNFGQAIEALKSGGKVARKGWNGKGMFLFLVKPILPNPSNNTVEALGMFINDSICMKTAQDEIVVGWLASQTDVLAEDWEVVE